MMFGLERPPSRTMIRSLLLKIYARFQDEVMIAHNASMSMTVACNQKMLES